jgi:hypothetical protein
MGFSIPTPVILDKDHGLLYIASGKWFEYGIISASLLLAQHINPALIPVFV